MLIKLQKRLLLRWGRSITANGQLIGEGREIVARLPNHLQKFNSATTVQNIFFTPAFRQ